MVEMGRIEAPFGVRGWVRARAFTQDREGLLRYREWWLGGDEGWKSYQVAEGRMHGKGIVARLKGSTDRETAGKFRGMNIAVPRSQLPETRSGEYYWADLVGLSVVNLREERLGKVAALMQTGANDVLVVKGDRERLIPCISSAVKRVDLAAGRVVVDWELDY